ncbi:MAG: TA system VapC family ribonuclease toxin [Candidatus Dormibacteraceae bacterium]
MIDLLDINILVSLAWLDHVHHRQALDWFKSRQGQPWATTPFTEAGFVRVSSNSSALSGAVTPTEAVSLLDRMREVPGHQFLSDDLPLVFGRYLYPKQVVTHRQVTDAHLLALARRHGARLATFDRGIATMANGEDLVLVPVT